MDVSGGSGALTASRPAPAGTARWLVATSAAVLIGVALFRLSRYQDHWVRSRSADARSPALVFSLPADAAVNGWLRRSTPRLSVGCAGGGGISVFVHTGLPAAVEPGSDRSVRLQVDSDEPTLINWVQAENHQALFAPPATTAALGRRLAQAHRF